MMKRIKEYFSPVQSAARKFRKLRCDYYEYLADVLSDSDGRVLLHGVFVKDSERFASSSFWRRYFPHPRAVLSAYWAQRFLETGAKVKETWRGTLPDSDMLIIGSATDHGGTGALPNALREVARLVRVMTEARNEFLSIITAAIFSTAIVLVTYTAIAIYLWPSIKSIFDFIPASYYGTHCLELENFSKKFPIYIGPVVAGMVVLAFIYKWSLGNWKGKARQWADKFVIYRVYKNYRGAMFLSTLSTLVKRGSGLNFREGIEAAAKEAEPWLQWYCERILEKVTQEGAIDGTLFDVGLLEDDALYYLIDMAEAKDFEAGLQLTGRKTEREIGKSLKLRAFVLRWSVLFAALIAVAYGLFGIFMAIRELNDAAKLVFL